MIIVYYRWLFKYLEKGDEDKHERNHHQKAVKSVKETAMTRHNVPAVLHIHTAFEH